MLGLIIGNGVLSLTRTAPDRLIPVRLRLAIALAAAVLGGLLVGLYPSSWALAFPIALAVHAGLRFAVPIAVSVVALGGATESIVLVLYDRGPWWLGPLMIIPVIFGTLRRERTRTFQAMQELLAQTHRASLSDARATALAERARIARDIHDVLAHSLSGVNMQLSMADALLEADRASDARSALQRAQQMVVDGLGDARRAVHALRTDAVDVVGAVQAMLSGANEHADLDPSLDTLDFNLAQVILRTIQEAVTNARRYAPGALIEVTAIVTDGAVELRIANDASTNKPPSTGGSGMGLIGMRERAALQGGTVLAGPDHNGGWLVHLKLPSSAQAGSARE